MKSKFDWTISALLLALSFTSLIIIFSIAPDNLNQQGIFLLIGFIIYLYFSSQDSAIYKNLSIYFYIFAFIALGITLIFGSKVRGSSRWIQLFGVQIQTSELIKPLIILSFSEFISKWKPDNIRNIALNLISFILPAFLIFLQPDLGTTIVYFVIWAAMMLVGGLSISGIITSIIFIISGFFASPYILKEYQYRRISAFLDPEKDPLGSGYNVIQSMIAIGSGKIFGKGLGKGTQSHLKFLPERHTDFVFASLAEEFGLVGALSVIGIFAALLYKLLINIPKLASLQDKLIVTGVFTYIFFQAFLNIAMNLGIAPVTGITLPLISVGGSSILATYISLGIAVSVINSVGDRPLIEIK